MTASPQTVLFVTGTFISNNCWDELKSYFSSMGYCCVAPAWPHKDASAEELRNKSADDAIALNTINSLSDYFEAIIKLLPRKPILIGHSLGGLVVQLLLQRQLGVAGVVIHSFPPQGIISFRLSFFKMFWETLICFTPSRQTYMIPFLKWKYIITNGMDCEVQKQLFYRYAIPESKKIIRDLLKARTKIDFRKSHSPLLFIAGAEDKMVRASINYFNYKQYDSEDSITDYRNFKGRNHLPFDHPQWKEEADFILSWLAVLSSAAPEQTTEK